MAQLASASGLGPEGPVFESQYPDIKRLIFGSASFYVHMQRFLDIRYNGQRIWIISDILGDGHFWIYRVNDAIFCSIFVLQSKLHLNIIGMKTLGFLRAGVLALGIAALGLCGCDKVSDESKKDLVEAYEAQCRKMNTNIVSLKSAVEAVGNEDYVIGAEPLAKTKSPAPAADEGYTVTFANAGPVVIYTDVAPLVAVEKDNGTYWWTLDGEFIFDENDGKTGVGQVTPQLKIEDAKWWISCDGGENWTEIESAAGNEKMKVTQDDENVYVEFNGQTLALTKTPPAPPTPTISFTINEVMASSVTFDVEVSDDAMRYTIMCVEKAYADQFENDEELYLDDLAYFNEELEYGYGSLAEVIADYTETGDQIGLEMPGLEPETEYLFYAYGLELDGTRTTDISREYVTTKGVEKVEVTFGIDAVVDGMNIDVAVTPSDNEAYYYFDGIEKESVDIDFGGDIAAVANYYIDYNVQMGTYYGMTAEEVILEIASKGPDSYTFSCAPNTEYVIFAIAVDLDGNIISDVTTKTVVTGDIVPSDNVITLNVDAKTSTSVTVSTTTTNEDPYFLGIEPAYKFAGMTDDEIIETVLYEYGEYLDWATEYGDVQGLELYDLLPGTEYMLLAFGVESYNATTPLVKMTVSTESGSDPALCTFDIRIEDITENYASVTITPSSDDVRFFSGCQEPGMSYEDFMAGVREAIDMYIQYGEVSDAIEFWQYMAVVGEDSWTATDLTPGTDYEIFAVPIDMTTGDFAAPLTRKSFTTLGTAPAASVEKALPLKFRKHENPSRRAGTVVNGAEPAHEALAPMRKPDLQDSGKLNAKRTVRHSAFGRK